MTVHVLAPGEFYFGREGEQIKTLLGSCVAITLWHPQRHVGGMCHFLLPSSNKPRDDVLDGRYGDQAMEMFMRELRRTATKPREYQVKLFGGGNMFPETTTRSDVGDRNITAATSLLKVNGFAPSQSHVGDQGHRTVILDLATGETWLRWQNG